MKLDRIATQSDRHERQLRAYEDTYRKLAAQLAEVGFIWPGTVVRQRLTCGKSRCACHDDEQRRHGPYVYWTTKVKGRTVSRRLGPKEAELITQWIQNRRQLDQTQRRMRAVSEKVAALLLRTAKPGRAPADG